MTAAEAHAIVRTRWGVKLELRALREAERAGGTRFALWCIEAVLDILLGDQPDRELAILALNLAGWHPVDVREAVRTRERMLACGGRGTN
jgi:hypothetical protein